MAWCTVKLETVTLVFAVINLLGSIFGCGVILCLLFVFPNDLEAPGVEELLEGKNYASPYNVFFTELAPFLGLVFHVLLLHGVIKKNADHIKAYFVYGVITGVIEVAVLLIYIDSLPVILFAILAMVMALYGLILYIVHETYKKFQHLGESATIGRYVVAEKEKYDV